MKTIAKKRAKRGKARIQYVIYVRRQDGSEGWRRAHEREFIKGCAAEVIGDIDVRADGRVWELGKRIGDMKGLLSISFRGKQPCQQDYGTYG